MSEWFYIWLSFGLTWVVVGGYAAWIAVRRAEAERALRTDTGAF